MGNIGSNEVTGSLLVTAARALVGEGLDVLEPAALWIEGRTIRAIQKGPTPDDDPTVIDCGDATLVPGFIDAHVHIAFADPAEVLRKGVTTVRDLGWPPDEIFPLSEASRASRFDGPLIMAAGQMLTAPGGYPTRASWAPVGTGFEVSSPAAAADAVERQRELGASVIKVSLNPPVGPTLDGRTLTAIVEAAHRSGLKTTGHVYGLTELEKALDAGLDELAHMLMSPERIPAATISRMVGQGMAVVPTLSCRFGLDRRKAIANLRALAEAGGTVVYGTDLGNAGPKPGIDRREVKAMGAAGLDGRAVVTSATVTAAEWLGLATKGALREGFDADVIAVPGDPLRDPSALTSPRLVIREGRIAYQEKESSG